MNKNLLIIYTKDPERGDVKSRLAKDIGPVKARFIFDYLSEKLKKEFSDYISDLWVSYGNAVPIRDLWSSIAQKRILQEGDTLGDRMYNDIQHGFNSGYEKVAIIGMDIPDIDSALVTKAFFYTQSNTVALGPSSDGGYYLVCVHRDLSGFRKLFSDIPWSSPQVFKRTCEQAEDLSAQVHALETLVDVDVIDDLNKTGLNSLLDIKSTSGI